MTDTPRNQEFSELVERLKTTRNLSRRQIAEAVRDYRAGDPQPVVAKPSCSICGKEPMTGKLWCEPCSASVAPLVPFFRAMASRLSARQTGKVRKVSGQKWIAPLHWAELVEIYVSQDGRCFFTGWELSTELASGVGQAMPVRRNLAGGFTRANTVLATRMVAEAANGCGANDFIKISEAVWRRHGDGREDALLQAIG